ncbi:glycosyltransferase family 4 protein [bacterium]|nr:glycosyltransferase family 4 protein [bacterium]
MTRYYPRLKFNTKEEKSVGRLKVGYVLRKFPVLSETFILNEILALEAQGISVTIFSMYHSNPPRFHEDLPKLKATVYYIPEILEPANCMKYASQAARRFGKKFTSALRSVLIKANPSLLWRFLQSTYVADKAAQLRLSHLHAHFASRASTVAQLAARMSGIPYSFTAHAFDIFSHNVKRKVLADKMGNAKFVVTVSDFNKKYLESAVNGASSRLSRIYNGIDMTRYSPNDEVPAGPFSIVSVGRLVEKKGHYLLIEACAHLKQKGIDFVCQIVGTGRLRLDLQALIEKSGLKEQVRLLGTHTQLEVVARYRAAHIFVLPCRVDSEGNRDGLPVAIVEALACGLPVVTTPTTGIPEVIKHGVNGLLIPDNDVIALVEAIESLIQNPSFYHQLRSNARESVLRNFDIRKTVLAIQKLLDPQRLIHEDLFS